jgi:DNA-directed RNA polymerase sigma subunit (sigma70/sigma32)
LPVVREACALEAAEQGGMTLEEIATRLSLTRERVRQIELGALKKLWARLEGGEGDRQAEQTVAAVRRTSRAAA